MARLSAVYDRAETINERIWEKTHRDSITNKDWPRFQSTSQTYLTSCMETYLAENRNATLETAKTDPELNEAVNEIKAQCKGAFGFDPVISFHHVHDEIRVNIQNRAARDA